MSDVRKKAANFLNELYADSASDEDEAYMRIASYLLGLLDREEQMEGKVLVDGWQPIETLKCGGDAVLLFSAEWIDPDFNPSGIREGFRNESDTGPIWSARWNDCAECWETDVNSKPTHWMPRPKAMIAAREE